MDVYHFPLMKPSLCARAPSEKKRCYIHTVDGSSTCSLGAVGLCSVTCSWAFVFHLLAIQWQFLLVYAALSKLTDCCHMSLHALNINNSCQIFLTEVNMKMHHCHYLHVNDRLERQNMYFKITPTFVIMAFYCIITTYIMIEITENIVREKCKNMKTFWNRILKRYQHVTKQRVGECQVWKTACLQTSCHYIVPSGGVVGGVLTWQECLIC